MRPPARVRKPLRNLALALCILAGSLTVLVTASVVTSVVTAPAVQAAQATAGTGRYRDMVQWISWGTAAQQIPGTTKTVTESMTIAGQTLKTTCMISSISPSAGLEAYRPGTWQGDGFDEMYNVGGTGSSNQLVVGLSNRTSGTTVTFNYSCSATLGGNNFPLAGLVFADAETSGGGTEWVGATPVVPTGGSMSDVTWRLIDRGRGANCTDKSYAYRFAATNRLEMFGPASITCEGSDSTRWPGASSVAFMDGATAATNVTVKGGGKSAIALGVSLQFDFGDAPASYGDAGAALQYTFSGGLVSGRTPGSTTATKPVSASGADRGDDAFALNLATVEQPAQRLGAVVDPELDPAGLRGALATGDDSSGLAAFGGPDDEDALDLGTDTAPAQLVMTPGTEFLLDQDITVHGAGQVAAWLDLNGNGTFDAGERSKNTLTGTGKLRWDVPHDLLPNGGIRSTYLRLRMVDTDETLSPTGISNAGEVEDYRVKVATPPRFTLTKKVGTRVDPEDQFTVQTTGPGITGHEVEVTTTGTETTRSTTTRLVRVGQAYTISDVMAAGSSNPISDYRRSISCVDSADDNAVVPVTGTGPWATATLAAGQYVVCTVTNTAADPKVEVAKTFTGITGPDASGVYTATYQVTVANSGPQATSYGVLQDQPSPAPSLQVVGAAWTVTATAGTAPPSDSATGAGPFNLAAASTALARRASHTYAVAVRLRYRNDTPATTCAGPGSGLYNEVSLPAGQETGGSDDNAACGAPPAPPTRGLALDKQVVTPNGIVDSNENGRLDAGDTIAFRFVLENTGQVTLTEVAVADPLVTGLSCPTTTLSPSGSAGDSTTCTAGHVITQADMDSGSFTNVATANGTDPRGGTVTSPPDTTSTSLSGQDQLVLTKSHTPVHDANASSRVDAGDTVTYSFTVVNTGTRTITGVSVSDQMFPGTIACTPSTLAPGAQASCASRTLTLTQAQVDAGGVDNVATATGTSGSTPVPSNPATDHVTITPLPSLALDKQVSHVADVDSSSTTGTGDTVTWAFTVRNTGTVTLDHVTLTDPLVGPVTCLAATLAPGATTTCTAAAHTITAAQTAQGSLDNTATATGTPPTGNPVSATDHTSTPLVDSAPGLRIVKQAGTPVDVNSSGITDAGDTITYTFTVTNTGNVPMTGVQVVDPKLGSLASACGPNALAVGASFTCSATYTVTVADQTAGEVQNSATATGTPPSAPGSTPTPVTSPPSSVTTPVTSPTPRLKIVKQAGTPVDVNSSGITDAGDTITYTFTVTNTGNVPMTGVQVVDPKLDSLASACGPNALAVGASFTCSATYTVTVADQTAGEVQNSATATGTPPGPGSTPGTPVTSPPSHTTTEVTPPGPSLSVVKRAGTPVDVNGTGITDAGDTLVFTFTVRNTGNVPLREVVVNDPMLAGAQPAVALTCPTGPLAPGASRTCTSAPWTISLSQEAAGTVLNTATATGTPPHVNGVPSSPVTSEPDSTTTPVTAQAPALSVVKKAGTPVDVNASGITDAGDTITYTFTITNTGNVPLTSVAVTDAKLDAAGVAITCGTEPLAAGETTTCTSGAYPVTAADEAAEEVRNVARASATPPRGPAVDSPPSTTTTTVITPDPRLVVDKQAGVPVDENGSGLTDAGDTVAYTFRVTNSGNVPLHGITVVDSTLTGQSSPAITLTCAGTTLAPQASMTCTTSAPYTVTAADVTAGAVTNTAHVKATDPDGDPISSPPDTTSVPTTRPAGALKLVKTAGTPVDTNSSGITDAGDLIGYTFTVTNTGNVPVRDIVVTDAKLAVVGITISCAATALVPGATTTCAASAPYTVTAADLRVGDVRNSATVAGTDPDNTPVRSPESTTSTPTTTPRPALAVDKDVAAVADRNHSGLTDAGDTVTWTFTVTNTGNVPLSQITLVDPLLTDAGLSLSCPSGSLAPGATGVCTASGPYQVTAVDEQAGAVANTATVTGRTPDGDPVTSPPDRTSTPVTVPQPGLEVEKTAGVPVDANNSGITDAGDRVAYSFAVTNTGNVPIRQVTIDDPKLAAAGLTIACTPLTLAVGGTASCATSAPYVITAADETDRAALNRATATGTDPDDDPVRSPEDSTSTPTTSPAAGLSVLKEAGAWTDVNDSGITDAGDRLAYRFTVTNTGNVPVHGVGIDDAALDPAPTCAATTLAPGASTTCTTTATHLVTAADEGNGHVVNTATARGTDPDGDPVGSPPDQVTVPVTTPAPALLVDKERAPSPGINGWEDLDSSGLVDVGDRITYRFTLTNTGNVPLTGVQVSDPRITPLPTGCGPLDLAVGASATCQASLLVTSTDVASGSVSNTAKVTGRDPDGDPVTSPPDTVTVPTTTPQPALRTTKTAGTPVDVNHSGITDAGDTISYTFTVTNTGNVPLRNVRVDDPKIGALPSGCTTALLGVGQGFTCSATYTVTAGDVALGQVANSATSTGTPPGAPGSTPPSVTSPPATTTTPTTRPEPALSVEKSADTPVDVNASGLVDAGDRVRYSFTVTNTGNVPISGVRISDPRLTDQGIATNCVPTQLGIGQSAVCTTPAGAAGEYAITTADAAAGQLTNRARASGDDPDQAPVTSPPDDVTIPLTTPEPKLTLDKTVAEVLDVNGSGITDAGDLVKYGFVVQNTGNVPLKTVTVNDAVLAGAAVPVTVTCGTGDLAPGASRPCTVAGGVAGGTPSSTGWYRVTAADVAAGSVTNTATVSATPPGVGTTPPSGPVTSPPDVTSVPVIAPEPKLALRKTVSGITTSDGVPLDREPIVGDRVTWTFTLTNVGNVPITDVTVLDPMLDVTLPYGSVGCGSQPLLPGQHRECTGQSSITQDQINTGRLDNTATATGKDPDGGTVTSPPDTASTPLAQKAGIDLVKQVSYVEDTNGSGITDAGDRVFWTFELINLGNVDLFDVSVSDPLLAAQNPAVALTCLWPAGEGTLPAWSSIQCDSVGASVVTTADQTAGRQENSATATGTPSGGPDVQDISTVTVPVTRPQPRLVLTKTAGTPTDVNASGLTDAGDTVAYTFTVRNAGNVPVTQIAVTDPKLDSQQVVVACDAVRLEPGESASCHSVGSYTVTAADVASGNVANAATATGNPPGIGSTPPTTVVTSPPATTTTPTTTPQPQLTLRKSVASAPVDVNNSGIADAGDTVQFVFLVTNSGNVPVSGLTVDDPKLGVVGGTCAALTSITLYPGEMRLCVSRSYTITAADVAAGAATNTATLTGRDPDRGTVTSPPSTASVPTTTPQPQLVIDKSVAGVDDLNGSGITDAGDRIRWTFTVTNTGNVPLNQVRVLDEQLAVGAPVCVIGHLAAGATAACGPFSRIVTESDEASGAVVNSATARGTDPDGGRVDSPPDTTATPVTTPEPRLSVDKTAGSPVDVNHSGITDAGDTITYTFTVTNVGNVPMTDLTVADAKLAAAQTLVTCPDTTLAPGDRTTCTSTPYRVSADDVVAGTVHNSATVRGTDPDGDPVSSPPDTTDTPTTRPAPALLVDKRAATPVDVNRSGITDAGDTVGYTFTVTNTGNVPVHSVAVLDPKLAAAGVGIGCGATTLAPGQHTTCSSEPYRITSGDMSAGAVHNSARVTGTDPDGGPVRSPEDATSVPVTLPAPSSTVVKSVVRVDDVNSSGITDAPDEIWYAFTITNTGNVPLSDVRVSDPLLATTAITCERSTLDPDGRLLVGDRVVCTAQAAYVVTTVDERAGTVPNTATAHGTDPDEHPVASDPDSESVPTTTPYAGLRILKHAGTPVDVNSSGITDAGDTIEYTFTVTNTGNVPIAGLAIQDPLTERAGLTISCPPGRLSVGAEVLCAAQAPYVVTEADEQAGHVANTATVTGTDPDGEPVVSPPDSTSTPVTEPQPGLSVDKEAAWHDTNSSGNADRGDTVDYVFTVTNTGNVPIDQVVVDDPMLARAGIAAGCAGTRLEPGQHTVCTATGYRITAADATAGQLPNRATALAVDPDGDDVQSPPDTVTVPLTSPDPRLEVVKHVTEPVDVDGDGRVSPGDTVAYTFTVTNTGNVRVHEVAVADAMLAGAGITVSCPVAELPAGSSTECAASGAWTISQAQVDAGQVVNTAILSGTDPWGAPVPPSEDTVQVPVPRSLGLALDKQAATPVDANGSGRTDAGDTVAYTFVVTNTGTSTLVDLVIADDLLTAAGEPATCAETTLAADQSTRCTATHALTGAELDAGTVDNVATARGTAPSGDPVNSAPDTTSTPLVGHGGLSLVKRAELTDNDSDGYADIGEQIRYTFSVTNTGSLTASRVTIVDPMLAGRGVSISCPIRTLAPGEQMTCDAVYVVATSDTDALTLRNVAQATGRTPLGDVLASTHAQAEVRMDPEQVLGVEEENPEPPGTPQDPTPGSDLPDTGGPALWWAALGGALLGAGVLAVLAHLRRPRRRTAPEGSWTW